MSNPQSTTFFKGGNVQIIGDNLNFHQHVNQHSSEPGLSILLQAASLSAAHDASARDPPPKCAPGTREKIVAEISAWIENPNPPMTVMWLSGPFGNGKSAIMQTVADRLRSSLQSSHLLAASFFFGRGKDRRDKADFLIPTMAYQIAISIPPMRSLVDAAIVQDPTILSKSIDSQLRYLVTNPLHQIAAHSSDSFHSPTVIVDGLDECEGRDSQRLILEAISTAVFTDRIQLRFLIASRPESQIAEIFRTHPLDQHYPITLVDDYQTKEEMRQYFQTGFEKIWKRRGDLMSTVKRPWPPDNELSTLVYRASGQFLYASTVLRFVDSDVADPVRQLALILERRAGYGIAFSKMDELYTLILELCPCQQNFPSFFRSLVIYRALGFNGVSDVEPTLGNYAIISGLDPIDISLLLRWLPAAIEFKWPRQEDLPDGWPLETFMQHYSPQLTVHHESFLEFLTDRTRSGKFYVNDDRVEIGYAEMLDRLDVIVSERLEQPICEGIPRIHRSSWGFVDAVLRRDLRYDHDLLVGWPRLHKILKANASVLSPSPNPEFLAALSSITWALVLSSIPDKDSVLSPTQAVIKKLADTCENILYLSFCSLSPSSKMWEIAGEIDLPHFNSSCEGILATDTMQALSEFTRLPIANIFQVFEEIWTFIDIKITSPPTPNHCSHRVNLSFHLGRFLWDEDRSGIMHLALRDSCVRAFKRRITNMIKADRPQKKLGPFFRAFCSQKWDVNITADLQNGSDMNVVIDLLHKSFVRDRLANINFDMADKSFRLLGYYFHHYSTLLWLAKQLQILGDIPNPTIVTVETIRKLRDMLDAVKEHDIRACFDNAYKRLKHFERTTATFEKFYSEISFLFNEGTLAAECHNSILKYYLLVNVALRTDGRSFLDDPREEYDFVQWECHFSNANNNMTIRYLLLTLCRIFKDDGKTKSLEPLQASLIRGGLAWIRRHKHWHDDFEMWSELDPTLGIMTYYQVSPI